MLNSDYVVCAAGRRDYYQVPLAVAEDGRLQSFVTTSYTPDVLDRWSWLLPSQLQLLSHARNVRGLPSHKTLSAFPSAELRRKLVLALGGDGSTVDQAVEQRLGSAAAHLVSKSSAGAIVYNYHWLAYQRHLQSRDLPPQILFQPHPAPWQVREVLREVSQSTDVLRRLEPEETAPLREIDAYRNSLDSADGILVPTAFVAKGLTSQGIPAEKIAIVPYGGDLGIRSPSLSSPRTRYRTAGSPLKLLWVGQITYRKGILTLSDAISRLPPGTVELTIIANSVAHPELLRALPSNTTVHLNVSDTHLQSAYNDHDLFVMPSYLEGSGLVYAEALNFGMPVIGTPNSCLPDVLPSEMHELLVAPGDADGLADLIERLAEDYDYFNSCVSMVSELRSCLTWEAFRTGIRQQINYFENLLC